jgi:hypothetical protein
MNKEVTEKYYNDLLCECKNVIAYYKGQFNEIGFLDVYEQLQKGLINYQSQKQDIFRLFVEMAQNIAQYSIEKQCDKFNKENGCGVILLCESENHFNLIGANPIYYRDKRKLVMKCEFLNSKSVERLRFIRRKQRNLPKRKKGNANIGLIQMILISKNLIKYDILKIDNDYNFFIVKTKINKI